MMGAKIPLAFPVGYAILKFPKIIVRHSKRRFRSPKTEERIAVNSAVNRADPARLHISGRVATSSIREDWRLHYEPGSVVILPFLFNPKS